MGSYVHNHRLPGEIIEYEARLSHWAFLSRYALVALALALALWIVSIPPSRIEPWVPDRLHLGRLDGADLLAFGSAALLALLALLILLGVALKIYSTELVITNRRVIAKFGLYSRGGIELQIKKIDSVHFSQGILERFFRYGTVIVSSPSENSAVVPGISDPIAFRDHYYASAAAGERDAPPPP